MKQLQKSISILFLFLPVFIVANPTIASKKKPLNILLITSDDLGKQLSCYGDDIIKTPNIDKLAESGIMFHNAYVSQASCSSSRSSILTGIYPHTNGQIGLAHRGFQLNKKYQNLPHVLKEHGYKTGIIGKLHVNPENLFPFDFDKKNYQEARDVELIANRAESFIKSSEDTSFFLYINYSDPHVPFYTEYKGHPNQPVMPVEVHEFDFQGVNDPEELERISGYYTCVRRLDEGIGLLMSKLEKLGVLENTLIFFIGDHGAPFDRGKGACYESSVKIPFLLVDPTNKNAKGTSAALVSTVDIFPTILDKLNIEIPAEVQGISLKPVIKDKNTNPREYLYTEFNHHINSLNSFYPRRTIRNDKYKLILNLLAPEMENEIIGMDGDKAYKLSLTEKYDSTWVRDIFTRFKTPPTIELYDLENDPFEKIDLSGKSEYNSIEKELLIQLKKWLKQTNDPFIDPQNLKKYVQSLNSK